MPFWHLASHPPEYCHSHSRDSLCYAMVLIWHDPFSFTTALASVVVWGLGGHSGSSRSSCARYMYFAFGVFFLQLKAQDKQHFPHRSTDSWERKNILSKGLFVNICTAHRTIWNNFWIQQITRKNFMQKGQLSI